MNATGLEQAAARMRERELSEAAIAAFARAYERLRAGDRGMLREAELEPLGEGVTGLQDLPGAAGDRAGALDGVAVIKLNGGLATSMGLTRAKSLLEAHDGRTFLDLIVGQVLAARARAGARLPLVLMDSFATRADTLAAMERRPQLDTGDGLPADFLQDVEPKLEAATLAPVHWPVAPELEWCPPGHGDLYVALGASGVLDALLRRDFRYAFVSNADNLGATPDARIAAWLAAEEIPFAMEVVQGTPADRKGGHIARRSADGRLVLREIAQTPPEEAASFRDYARWRWYNTNSLWIDLRRLAEALRRAGGALELPPIFNHKTVDPRDPSSPAVVQLETAMGAAIATFPGARVLHVPRERFIPVKTTDDLLVLRSDAYRVDDDASVDPVASPPLVELDPDCYKLLSNFEARFPHGPPSLAGAQRLTVRGDVTFEADVAVRGAVELDNAGGAPARITAGTELAGSRRLV